MTESVPEKSFPVSKKMPDAQFIYLFIWLAMIYSHNHKDWFLICAMNLYRAKQQQQMFKVPTVNFLFSVSLYQSQKYIFCIFL